jgi:hypothetical protein
MWAIRSRDNLELGEAPGDLSGQRIASSRDSGKK